MSPRRPSSPGECLIDWLSAKLKQTRCEWVIDPDRLVDWGNARVHDKAGRSWLRALYSGDDVAFRRAFRSAAADAEAEGCPVLLAVTKGSANPERIDISHITDILSFAESDPLDISILAFFKRLFPKVNPPHETLRKHKDTFLENISGLKRAYEEFKQRWGEPDSWGRDQLLAILVLARHHDLRLSQVYCDDQNAVSYLSHVCWLVTNPAIQATETDLIWDLIRESRSAQVAVEDVESWYDHHPSELAAYLVLRYFLAQQGLQNPAALLAGSMAFGLDPHALELTVTQVVRRLQERPGCWESVNRRSEPFLQERRLKRIIEMVDQSPETLSKAISADVNPVLLQDILGAILGRFFGSRDLRQLAWTDKVKGHPLLHQRGSSPAQEAAACLLRCAHLAHRVEQRLGLDMPAFRQAEDALAWYLDNEIFTMEMDTSDLFYNVEQAGDPELGRLANEYVFSQSTGVRSRVRQYLNRLDEAVAAFIRPDVRKFAYGSRSALKILPELVVPNRPAGENAKTWILLFDGMRYDTWRRAVRPVLEEHFQVVDGHDQAYFTVLPSKTGEARRALLAGALADKWKAWNGRPTRNEAILAARQLGLTNAQSSDLRFVTDADTTEARRRMGFTDADARRYNVLIYPISDDLGHFHNDTLTSLNAKVRQMMLGDKVANLRGIVDDVLSRVGPDDLVLITSDHGFMELFPGEAIQFSRAETHRAGVVIEEAVQYRHLRNFDREDLKDVVRLDWDTNTKYVLPVGGQWFAREGGRPTRYAHGGVSLAEMVVPGVLLRRISEKMARVEIVDLPAEITVGEDEAVAVEFGLKNVGNISTDFEVELVSSLGERLLDEKGKLTPGRSERFKTQLIARYAEDGTGAIVPSRSLTSISVIFRHTDSAGQLKEPLNGRTTVPVSVKPKPAKIATDALQQFDNV